MGSSKEDPRQPATTELAKVAVALFQPADVAEAEAAGILLSPAGHRHFVTKSQVFTFEEFLALREH